MKPAPFEYFAPTTIENAIDLLAAHDQARPLAGGQSLVPMMNLRLARPSALVDLNRIPGLAGITEVDGELRIGGMTRQATMLHSPLVARLAPLLIEALGCVGHPPTRARGTIGGSLSNADPAAELPVAMLALGAQLVVRSAIGERLIGASEFFRGMFETVMSDGELLIEIRIPSSAPGVTSFVEVARRRGDFAVVSAATRLVLDEAGCCTCARIVLGAVGPVPVHCRASEEFLMGRILTDAAVAEAAAAVASDLIEFETRGASRSYRLAVGRVLVRRSLEAARNRGNAARS